jgi:hypothetical protein
MGTVLASTASHAHDAYMSSPISLLGKSIHSDSIAPRSIIHSIPPASLQDSQVNDAEQIQPSLSDHSPTYLPVENPRIPSQHEQPHQSYYFPRFHQNTHTSTPENLVDFGRYVDRWCISATLLPPLLLPLAIRYHHLISNKFTIVLCTYEP